MHSYIKGKSNFQFPSRMPGYGNFTALAKGKTKPAKAIYITPLNAVSSVEHCSEN
jgi:hypothetical protein